MTDADVMTLAIQLSMAFYDKRAAFLAGLGGLSARDWLNLSVAALGAVCMFVCTCRMGKLTKDHKWAHKLSYVALLFGGFCLTFAPWLFDQHYVRVGALVFLAAVIAHLVVLGREWWHGLPPAYMKTDKPGERE